MINIQNLHFAYHRKKVFDGLNLQFELGSIYGILGKNGSGKSTLLMSILGLLFPETGSIEAFGYPPASRRPEYFQKVYMVPEEFFLPKIKITKFVQANAPFYPKFDLQQFERYLQEFEVPVDNTMHQMSYGQKKKVLISFGLACNTNLLLLDEPTNGLDITSKGQFRKILAGAISEEKCIIISTHQVKDLDALIDHVTIIDEGKVLFDHGMEAIQEALSFEFSFNKDDALRSFYAESSLSGVMMVKANKDNTASKIDLELLYKAVMTNGAEIAASFENQTIHS